MSGGFFRGTSADQDTRFSNKQAKLLKSQKFAPELEQLVDMTKVKMDVMRPWIATRVTELIGFEDEVLINFIYGLLDGKEVNGKEIQISLTGFMERNTGKFMKELWSLLLSAQKNASGVPQQFLDAKEEETKKKKAESDRVANEIRKKKEEDSRELEQERTQKMDRGNDIMKDVDTGTQLSSKHQPRAKSAEAKESKERNGLRGQSRVSKSPHSADHSSSPRGRHSRSISKSLSNSRSYSHERRSSRSLSASPEQRGRSSSSELVHRHSIRLSFSPRRRSTYSRRRSLSRSHHRSPSPARYRMRSPLHRRSRSPIRRRSRSPIWRRLRSPTRQSSLDKSQSPIRHRPSFVRHRSPSPIRRTSPSPIRRKYQRSPSTPRRRSRTPVRRRYRTPVRRRSPSPVRRRSPSPVRRRSPSPVRRRSSPVRRRSPSPIRHDSPSPIRRRSPIAGRRRSLTPRSPSPLCRKSPRRLRRTPLQSPKGRIRSSEKYSPVRHAAPRITVEHSTDACQRSNSSEFRSQSDSPERNKLHREVKRSSPSPQRSPSVSESERQTSLIEKGRKKVPRSDSSNPPRKAREIKHHDDSSEMSADDKETTDAREAAKNKHHSTKISSSDQHKGSRGEGQSKVEFSPLKTDIQRYRIELSKKDQVLRRGNNSEKLDHQKKPVQLDSQMIMNASYRGKGRESPVGERHGEAVGKTSYPADIKINDRHLEAVSKLSREAEQNCQSASLGSESEESDKSRTKAKDKRKRKRSERRGLESSDESSYDSYAEKRKEAKRRRKEEKRLKKNERRRRREERRRRKEERHAKKQKLRSIDAVSSPSDTDRNHDGRFDDDQHAQKKLEIELREKALESLRAKKGIGN